MSRRNLAIRSVLPVICALAGSCGSTAAIFNPAFVTTLSGGVVPVTPGPAAPFVLVRGVNETNLPVEFIVTIERAIPVRDEFGNLVLDENGNVSFESERQTVRLETLPSGRAADVGTLFPCAESPVMRVGLGENLLPTDAAVFVGGGGVLGAAGFGVPADNINPLELTAGNFNCGDTIIYRAFLSTRVAGGVALQTFLLPGSEQPSVFQGPSTFVNFDRFVQSQRSSTSP